MFCALHTQRFSIFGGQSTHLHAAPFGMFSRLKSFMDPKDVTFRHFLPPSHQTKRSKSCEHFARIIGELFFEFAQLPRT